MNYETRTIGQDERWRCRAIDGPSRRRRAARDRTSRSRSSRSCWSRSWLGRVRARQEARCRGQGRPPNRRRSVTVIVARSQTVDRVVTANGSLAARREHAGRRRRRGRVRDARAGRARPVGRGGSGARDRRPLGPGADRREPGRADPRGAGRRDAGAGRTSTARRRWSPAASSAAPTSKRKTGDARRRRRARPRRAGATGRAAGAQRPARHPRACRRAGADAQVEPGQVVSAGSGVLFRMAKGGEMEMRAQLAESDLAGLRAGARATVTPVGTDAKFRRPGVAGVARHRSADAPGHRAHRAEIRSGAAPRRLRRRRAIVSGASAVPLLPESAVQSDRTGNYVYIVGADDTRDQASRVKVGEVTDQGVSIVDGLERHRARRRSPPARSCRRGRR